MACSRGFDICYTDVLLAGGDLLYDGHAGTPSKGLTGPSFFLFVCLVHWLHAILARALLSNSFHENVQWPGLEPVLYISL